jgi:hypothetical protein
MNEKKEELSRFLTLYAHKKVIKQYTLISSSSLLSAAAACVRARERDMEIKELFNEVVVWFSGK